MTPQRHVMDAMARDFDTASFFPLPSQVISVARHRSQGFLPDSPLASTQASQKAANELNSCRIPKLTRSAAAQTTPLGIQALDACDALYGSFWVPASDR